MTPEQIRDAIRDIRRQTDKPFAVNLFVPDESPMPSQEQINQAQQY